MPALRRRPGGPDPRPHMKPVRSTEVCLTQGHPPEQPGGPSVQVPHPRDPSLRHRNNMRRNWSLDEPCGLVSPRGVDCHPPPAPARKQPTLPAAAGSAESLSRETLAAVACLGQASPPSFLRRLLRQHAAHVSALGGDPLHHEQGPAALPAPSRGDGQDWVSPPGLPPTSSAPGRGASPATLAHGFRSRLPGSARTFPLLSGPTAITWAATSPLITTSRLGGGPINSLARFPALVVTGEPKEISLVET